MTRCAFVLVGIVCLGLLAGIVVSDDSSGRPAADVASAVTLFDLVLDADPDTARECLAILTAKVQSGEVTGRRLDALRPRLEPKLAAILNQAEHPLHFDAALLSTAWKDPAGLRAVRGVFTSGEEPSARRLAALGALVAAGDGEVVALVDRTLAAPDGSPAEFRGQVLGALGRLDNPRLADVVLVHFSDLEPDVQPRAVELLTQRVAWGRRLIDAVGRGEVPAESLNLNQVRRLLSLGDDELAERVRTRWGTIRQERNPDRERVIAEMKDLIAATPGDPLAGRTVFRKVCAQCHKIFGEGEDVGPDLTENGRSTFDQLLSNVFDPSLVIGAAYQAHTVLTADGRVLTGLLVEDGPQRLVLKVQGGKTETIARADVEEHQASDVSMMPEGIEKQLTPQEIADLFAFLMLPEPPE